MVRMLARSTKDRGFDFRPFHFQVTTLGKLCASVIKQYNLVPAKGRRTGHASQT